MSENKDTLSRVVVNDEGQYSVWAVDQELPLGWRAVGEPASKEDCLNVIAATWTDIRPLSAQERSLT